jgi:hypothetical protein
MGKGRGGVLSAPRSHTHNRYVTNLNASLEKYAEAEGKGDVATMIALQVCVCVCVRVCACVCMYM